MTLRIEAGRVYRHDVSRRDMLQLGPDAGDVLKIPLGGADTRASL